MQIILQKCDIYSILLLAMEINVHVYKHIRYVYKHLNGGINNKHIFHIELDL